MSPALSATWPRAKRRLDNPQERPCSFGLEDLSGRFSRVLRAPGPSQTRFGAVAQLGERVNGIHEVRGSIPLGSTNVPQSLKMPFLRRGTSEGQ